MAFEPIKPHVSLQGWLGQVQARTGDKQDSFFKGNDISQSFRNCVMNLLHLQSQVRSLQDRCDDINAEVQKYRSDPKKETIKNALIGTGLLLLSVALTVGIIAGSIFLFPICPAASITLIVTGVCLGGFPLVCMYALGIVHIKDSITRNLDVVQKEHDEAQAAYRTANAASIQAKDAFRARIKELNEQFKQEAILIQNPKLNEAIETGEELSSMSWRDLENLATQL